MADLQASRPMANTGIPGCPSVERCKALVAAFREACYEVGKASLYPIPGQRQGVA
jgi:hypothetical protein